MATAVSQDTQRALAQKATVSDKVLWSMNEDGHYSSNVSNTYLHRIYTYSGFALIPIIILLKIQMAINEKGICAHILSIAAVILLKVTRAVYAYL